ncbi:MAG TPA: metallophosphoesterase [Polyangiaceae bacterium]|nr:metallophosphoesterase [Polyangiaceae bacterium]
MKCHEVRGLILFGLCSVGCLSPAAERAEHDATVGYATVDDRAVVVAEGLAAVRHAGDDRLVLWASAPSLSLSIARGAATDLEMTIENCMPDLELVVDRGVASVVPLSSEVPTQKRFQIQLGTAETRFTARSVTAVSGAFAFGVMSDVQEAIDEVQDVFGAMNREVGLDFILGAGDLTERGSRSELARFQHELRSLRLPYYTTLGNHELGNDVGTYQQYFGRGSFSFSHRGVRFTLLDSASATIDDAVYDWLDHWLALGQRDPHVVAMHIPPLDPTGVRNGAFASRAEAAKLLGLLARSGVDLTLYGHIHSYYSFINAGIDAHISGGGGAIPERFDNIGRHFLVVEVADAGTLSTRVVRVD